MDASTKVTRCPIRLVILTSAVIVLPLVKANRKAAPFYHVLNILFSVPKHFYVPVIQQPDVSVF